jgi:hypothetical protein
MYGRYTATTESYEPEVEFTYYRNEDRPLYRQYIKRREKTQTQQEPKPQRKRKASSSGSKPSTRKGVRKSVLQLNRKKTKNWKPLDGKGWSGWNL